MRASQLFKAPQIWLAPAIIVIALVFVMTLFYLGSVVNPSAHIHDLPVSLVDEDAGATVGGTQVNFGRQVAQGLVSSPAVSSRLTLNQLTLSEAKHQLDLGKEYAAIVIPPDFSASLVAIAGGPVPPGQPVTAPRIELLTNPRAGTLGVSLSTGIAQPALMAASKEIGRRLSQSSPAATQSTATKVALANPVTIPTVVYRPLPSGTALGLSAFYVALLTTFCGFLGATLVHTAVDAGLGYSSSEIGPVWRQRLPVLITRWQTLLAKWGLAVGLTAVLTAVMLLVAVGILGMNAPDVLLLWLLAWFAAAVIAIGTLVLFAALGTLGQLVALLLFVYLALASSGGTVPLEALSGFFRFVANFEPLRQILDGVRAILYFDAQGPAGLNRAWIATAVGLVFWLTLGILVTTFYDRRGLYRMPPSLMRHLGKAVREYQEERRQSAQASGGNAEAESTSSAADA
jgi:YhgE/Pip-like protein